MRKTIYNSDSDEKITDFLEEYAIYLRKSRADIEAEANSGDERAKLSLDVFHELVASYIAKCAVAMNGIDVITFAAGVGEKGQDSRQAICEKLEFLGVKLDKEKNQEIRNVEAKISSNESKIQVYVVPTNEELMIAKETRDIIEKI